MKRSLLFWILVTGSALNQGGERSAIAAGKPPVSPSCGSPSVIRTPSPIRNVLLQPIGTKVFPLPNGVSVDMGVDLQSILNTAVASADCFLLLIPFKMVLATIILSFDRL